MHYRLEQELAALTSEQRLARRRSDAKPLWEQLHAWLQLERSRVPDGSITAKALDYSLKNWPTLTHHLLDGGDLRNAAQCLWRDGAAALVS